ncbi:MAG: Nif3-like dinuclear metal center hexameric protein [Betaproteobacteria bacterium]|nr:Nif3-like dinuclear metal center hexameric protein [Betaproteobacteria bacterium]
MQLNEIINIIEEVAPLSGGASWDNSGMQLASYNTVVQTLALCLDPKPSAIRRAAQLGVQLLITHHPLLITPRLPAVLDNFHEALSLLFKSDMALYAAHTSLDTAMDGPAGWLAQEFDLREMQVLEPCAGLTSPLRGFGCVGKLPEPLPLNILLTRLAGHISLDGASLSGPPMENSHILKRIAYCPGSGSSLIQAAADAGADIFITGDVKYHSALDAPLPLLDVGHHSLEEEMIRRFAFLMGERLRGLEVHFIPSTNPVRPAMPAGV